MTLVYSTNRERRLRLMLRIVLALGVMLLVLAAWAVIGVGGESERVGAYIAGMAVVLLVVSGLALRALPARDRSAKISALATGVVTLVAGFALLRTIVGFAMIVLAITVLALAVVRDDPDLAT